MTFLEDNDLYDKTFLTILDGITNSNILLFHSSLYVEETNWSFYNRTLPKSNLKSGSAPGVMLALQSKTI